MRWSFLLLVGACGRVGFDAPPVADADAGAHDGTRLRIVWNTFDDGTRTPAGIFDSERGEPCEVHAWSDGALYCTPTQRTRALFADAACTDALAPTAACGAGRYAFTDELCTGRLTHLYAPGAPAASGTVYASSTSAMQCIAQSVAPAVFATIEVPPAELARIDVAGAAVRAYTSDDGFALPFALRDDEHGLDCVPAAGADGYTCLPAASDDPVYGLDAACATRVTAAPVSCPAPDFIRYPAADCHTHVARVTSTIGGIGGFTLPICTGAENGPFAEWYLVGDDVRGPPLQREVDPVRPGHRLATISFAPGLRDAALFDTLLGIECTPAVTSDGVARCVPAHRAGLILPLSTMACGAPSAEVALVSLGCADPAPEVVARPITGPACEPTRVELDAVGAPTIGYGFFSGECPALPAFEIGAPIDPTIYAAFTTSTDP